MGTDKYDRDEFAACCKQHRFRWKKVCFEMGMSKAQFYNMKKEVFGNEFVPIPEGEQPKETPKVPENPKPKVEPKATGLGAAIEEMLKSGLLDEDKVREIAAEEAAKIPAREKIIVLEDNKQWEAPEGEVFFSWFETVLRKVKANVPALLIGPAGSGKSHGAKQISKALETRFTALSLTAGMSEAHMLGWLVPGEHGKVVFLTAEFVEFYENGGLFCLDELDAADPNVLLVINAAVANGELHIPHRVANPLAKRHDDFRLIACANTYGHGANREYQGRNALDAATLDRFIAGRVYVDYEPDKEALLPEMNPKVHDWGLKLRDKIAKRDLRRQISTRQLLDFSKLSRFGETREDWESSLVMDWNEDEKQAVGIA